MLKLFCCSSVLISLIVMCPPVLSQEKTGAIVEDFRLKFPGGTVAEYVELIQSTPFLSNSDRMHLRNLVVQISAQDIRLPSINIETNTTGAVGLLDGYQTDSVLIIVENDPSGNLKRVRAEYNEPIGTIVVNCRQLLEHDVEVSDLIEAIEFGLEMQGKMVQIKLHKKTGLLFAKGPNSATALVEQTIRQLLEAEKLMMVGQSKVDVPSRQESSKKESRPKSSRKSSPGKE